MVKRKSLPQPAERAGYAARTAPRVSDSTNNESSEEESARKSPRKSGASSKLLKLTSNKPKSKKLTPALRQIRDLQKSTNLLIPRAPFLRLVS